MPWSKKSKPKAGRVVRRRLADGTIKEYRYSEWKPSPLARPRDTIWALIDTYRESPEWRNLAEATRANYAVYLRRLEKIGHTLAVNMTRRDILSIRDAIAFQRGNGASTAFLRTASALFAWAVDHEWVQQSPVHRIKPVGGGHLMAWTPEQAAIAMRGLPEHLRRVVALGLYTGQRRGDLCTMGWSAYDGQTIRLVQQKTGAPLVLPVHAALKSDLDCWQRVATTILTDRSGRPWKPTFLSQVLPVELAKLKLPAGLNVHGLRKLAAANLADAGCSVHEIAAVTGHASLSMVQLYTRTADQRRLAEAAIVRLQLPYNRQSGQKRQGQD